MTDQPYLDPATEDLFLAHCIRRKYRKQDVIIRAGDSSGSLFYIVRGSAAVTVENADGKDMIVAYLDRGEFIGELGVFYDDLPRSAWVRARGECEVAEISYRKFHQLVQEHVEVLYGVGRQLVKRLVSTTKKAADFAFHDVNGRIERTLVGLARQADASRVDDGRLVRCTRQELARMVGCSREVAGRALKELENSGRIEVNGKSVLVRGEVLESALD